MLTIKTYLKESTCMVEFEGRIDEDSVFDQVLEIKTNEYHFNFEKIEMINSCGIRNWMTFIGEIDDSAKILYQKCSQVIIEQMNMVNGFIKQGASIESFYAPYYCDPCDIEIKMLLNSDAIKNRKAPVVHCSKCQKEMEFDGIEDQYFNFI